MPDAEEFAPQRPSRRRLLLWLVPLAAIVLGLIGLAGSRLMEYRRNCAAAERVEELGGGCEWETCDLPWPFPLLGDEWSMVRVGLEGIRLGGTSAGDEDLAGFAGLTRLKWLDLNSTQVTDAGLAHLAKLAALQVLYRNNTQVTDAGLVHLSKLSKLMGLDLGNTQVTDAGVEALKEALPNLSVER